MFRFATTDLYIFFIEKIKKLQEALVAANKLAKPWLGRGDDCGRLARAVDSLGYSYHE
jgi:hypothetical protein